MKQFEEHSHTYQTGRTQPPKSCRGLLAFSMILVIFSAGAVSALSLMNIHIFQMKNSTPPVCFSQEDQTAVAAVRQCSDGIDLGIMGKEPPKVYRSYQAWPQGIYISAVSQNSLAEKAGVQIGDILVAINEISIANQADLAEVQLSLTQEDCIVLTVFRDGQEMKISLPK